jgi:hypothetical protein
MSLYPTSHFRADTALFLLEERSEYLCSYAPQSSYYQASCSKRGYWPSGQSHLVQSPCHYQSDLNKSTSDTGLRWLMERRIARDHRILRVVPDIIKYRYLPYGTEPQHHGCDRCRSSIPRLAQGEWKPQPIWLEKVRYFSPLLTNMCCTCALHAAILCPQSSASPHPSSLKMLYLFDKLPLFRSLSNPQLTLELALAESQALLPFLHSARLAIFPRLKDLDKEKYMEIILFA